MPWRGPDSERQSAPGCARPPAPDRYGAPRVRGWKAWLANGSMTPARATAMIQVAAQLLRTSVISAASPRRPDDSRPPSRMPMSAARSARVICGAWSMARYSAGSRASAALALTASSRCVERRRSARSPPRRRRPSRPPRNRRAPRASRRSAPAMPASLGSSATALRKCSSAASVVALSAFRRRPARDRETRCRARLAIAAV